MACDGRACLAEKQRGFMAIDIAALTPSQVAARHAQIVAIYRRAFTPPPYHKPEAEIADFAHSFPHHVNRDSYRFEAAVESDSDRLVGFAYGYRSTTSRWWHEHVGAALTEPTALTWLQDSFQLVEIAVDPAVQGRGIGGRLHDHLLACIPHDRAVLTTLQAETVAHHLYRSRGWVVLCEDLCFPGVPRRYQTLGLELKPQKPTDL